MTITGSPPRVTEKDRAKEFSVEMEMARHHCLVCGWTPVEGMRQFIAIWSTEAVCFRCGGPLPSVQPLDGSFLWSRSSF